jgi:hypothetical protein
MSKNQEPPFSLRLKVNLRNRILALKGGGETWHSTVVRLLTLGVQTAEGVLNPPPEVQIALSGSEEPPQVPVKVEIEPTEEEDFFKDTDFAQ